MCRRCDYESLLNASQLKSTDNRIKILEVVGNNTYPLSADDVYTTLKQRRSINRVTVYRILDLLVDSGLVERLSTGGRAFYYGLAPNDFHHPHPHFYCKRCGRMECLHPESIAVNADPLWKTFPGQIEKVEVRIDGVCKNCLK